MSQTFGGMETKWDAHISIQAREKEKGRKQDTGATREGDIRESEESRENISSV